MHRALTAEVLRLFSLRSTLVFAVLLVGSCFGPVVLMTLLYDVEYSGPIDASDLGKCVSIFHVLAIVFAGAHTATEIRTGADAMSFLTQRTRWSSLVARLLVTSAFLVATYVVGMSLALTAASLYPDGLTVTAPGWAYLGTYLLVVLLWAAMTTSLASLTRSVAAAVAIPLTWMLLLEQLMSMLPMLERLVQWMPFTAGMTVLADVLGASAGPAATAPPVIGLLTPVVLLLGVALVSHVRRDVPG